MLDGIIVLMNNEETNSLFDSISNFIGDHAVAVIFILVLSYAARTFALRFIHQLIRKSITGNGFKTEKDEKQREDTLISIVDAGLKLVIWLLTGLLVLQEIGIDIGPLIAGAGIAGVAIGFGAQSMVKDFLAGIFIIYENQYRVGDVIEVNQSVSGTVQDITLRRTVLRDLDGMVHSIPNGEITIATNMTMEFANVNFDIGVGYDTNIEKLEKVVNKVGEDLAADKDWSDKIQEAPRFVRINEFGDSAIVVKILGRTEPMQQWAVTGELRKRIKIAFDKNKIEIPFPQRVIHEAKKSS